MNGPEATLTVIDALEDLGIPYMLVGSLSSSFYGIPRSTRDADFVVQFGHRSISEVVDRLGAAFRLDPQMSFETFTMTSRHVIKTTDTAFRIELFHLSDDAYDQERFQRRRRVPYAGREVSLPTAEDVIVNKLRWAIQGRREKDQEDVRDVIAVQRNALDWSYVERWTDTHGSRQLLEEIRRSLSPPGGGAP
jgi:hypothetical protein